MATVKGDVHDIGKNIVAVVLRCNNYEVLDLGVMVPATEDPRRRGERKLRRRRPVGLITPSLDEMAHVAREMKRREHRPPAPDRRRDHESATHRRQDRPGIRRSGGPRARRVPGGRCRLGLPRFDPQRAHLEAKNRGESRISCEKSISKNRANLCGRLSPRRRRTPSPALRRRDRRDALVLRAANAVSPDLATTARVHRLDLLLHRVGTAGEVSADPVASEIRRSRARALRQRAGVARRDHARRHPRSEGRVRLLAGGGRWR